MAEFSFEEAVVAAPPVSGGDEFTFEEAFAPPPAMAKPSVGFFESLLPGAGRRLAQGEVALRSTAALPAVAYDWVNSLFSGRTETGAQDWMFENFVDPAARMEESLTIDPATQTTMGKVGTAVGSLGADLPTMLLSGGRSELPRIGAGAVEIARGLMGQGLRTMAVPATTTGLARERELGLAGVDPLTAGTAGATTGLTTALGGGIPLSVPGRLGLRLGSGAAAGAGMGQVERGLQNQILTEYPDQQREFSLEDAFVEALPSALLGGLLGPRAAPSVGLRPPTVPLKETDLGIVLPPERPTPELIADAVGLERQRGTDAETGARVKQRRQDVQEAFRAAETEGGIMRREDVGQEQQRPATDATGTVYTDPAELAAARRERPRGESAEIDPAVRYAYERRGLDPDAAALAFERARLEQDQSPEVRSLKAEFTDEEFGLIERQMGLTRDEVAVLKPNSQRKLLAKAMESDQANVARNEAAGPMEAVNVRQQEPEGVEPVDYAARPNRELTPEDQGTRIASGPKARPVPTRDTTATREQLDTLERMRREGGLEPLPALPPRADLEAPAPAKAEAATPPAPKAEAPSTSGIAPELRARLSKTEVDVPVREAETGRVVKVKMRADEAIADVDMRLGKLRALWECLNA